MFYPNEENCVPWNTETYPIGVPNGIPETQRFCDVTQAYNVDASGNTDCTAGINQALADCPSGQHVYLPPGRYLVSGSNSITFPNPLYTKVEGKILKGAGAETIIVDRSNAVALIHMACDMSWTMPTAVPIIGCVAKGEGTLTVEDPIFFRVGEMVYIDQDNDDDEVGTPVSGMPNGQTERLQRQVVQITAIDGQRISFLPHAAWDFHRIAKLNDFGWLNGTGDN